jgi:hypothetical protein
LCYFFLNAISRKDAKAQRKVAEAALAAGGIRSLLPFDPEAHWLMGLSNQTKPQLRAVSYQLSAISHARSLWLIADSFDLDFPGGAGIGGHTPAHSAVLLSTTDLATAWADQA